MWSDEHMPVDAAGNRADLIMDGDSSVKRLIPGAPLEQAINAASRDLTYWAREQFGLPIREIEELAPDLTEVERRQHREAYLQQKLPVLDPERVTQVAERLLSYYEHITPLFAEKVRRHYERGHAATHVASVLAHGIYLQIPTNNPVPPITQLYHIYTKFPPTESPLTYGPEGTVTADVGTIGSTYFMLLEKLAGEFSTAPSAKRQHHGLPAKVGQADRHSYPVKESSTRITGEAEMRLINNTIGSRPALELSDRTNNPAVASAIITNIVKSELPFGHEEIVDRNIHPYGKGRNLLHVHHVIECAGAEFVREQDDPYRIASIEEDKKRFNQ